MASVLTEAVYHAGLQIKHVILFILTTAWPRFLPSVPVEYKNEFQNMQDCVFNSKFSMCLQFLISVASTQRILFSGVMLEKNVMVLLGDM